MAQISPLRPTKTPTNIDGWQPEDKDEVALMFNRRESLNAIAKHFNTTRGAISGLIMRMRKNKTHKIPHKSSGIKSNKSKPPTSQVNQPGPKLYFVKNAPVISLVPPKKPRIRLRLVESEMAVTLQELTKDTCRWPQGDPRRSDFRFCGCRPLADSPYCEEHSIRAGRAYEPSKRAPYISPR